MTNEEKCDEIYIGKTTIFDDNLNIAVVDWRAPISSIYYDGTIGATEYKCPEGVIYGDEVKFIKTKDEDEKICIIQNKIEELTNRNFKNIAIITKDLKGSKELYSKLKNIIKFN